MITLKKIGIVVFKDRYSFFWLSFVLLYFMALREHSHWWLLLAIPLSIIDGFGHEIMFPTPPTLPTKYFNNLKEAQDYMLKNLTELCKTGANLVIKKGSMVANKQ
jgi:hypothetical protein